MNTFEQFRKRNIDFAAIGLQQCDHYEQYYCTPKDAVIIGSAGVDGIHYCTIPEFGEMVFAVSPMNLGDCVHPIARSFADLLRLLLSCVDMAALEQCYAWDEEQYNAFRIDCPATKEQREVLAAIQREFGLEPIEDVFAYVKQLQAEFDLTKIPYTDDYYDPDMNSAAQAKAPEWKVTYNGGKEGNAGVEVSIGKSFCWGSEKWYIPAVYICDEGLVIDYLMEADPTHVKAFIDKWDLFHEDRNHYTKQQQEQILREHPLNVNFFGKATFNGESLQDGQGSSLFWMPASCLPKGTQPRSDAEYILKHYGLDLEQAWSVHRWSYRWGAGNGRDMQTLSVRMERQYDNISGQHFITPAVGEGVSFSHPLTGQIYTLTVHEVKQQELPADAFRDPTMEYPTHFTAISYSLEPDIPGGGFMLQDCAQGDQPRQKKRDPNAFETVAFAGAAAIGVIGGADGPTAVIVGNRTPKLHAACSVLHFEPVDAVSWRTVFREKLYEDMIVQII